MAMLYPLVIKILSTQKLTLKWCSCSLVLCPMLMKWVSTMRPNLFKLKLDTCCFQYKIKETPPNFTANKNGQNDYFSNTLQH